MKAPGLCNATGVRVACDSLVALGSVTAEGRTLFAKNSDRPASECQPLVQIPAARHAPGARLRCQYVDIPQVAETLRVLGSRPYWLWGFEHGLNERGVAIGNHTVFSKDPLIGQGLIGMDLVRLGLERAGTAARAVEVISALVETHGQGGSGYPDKEWPYHNSFLIADPREAYALETSDRRWAVRRVTDVASLTNHLTIGSDWDALAPGTIEHAIAQGWWDESRDERFDFAAAFRDAEIAPAVVSSGRHRRTCDMLRAGALTAAALRAALRDHAGEPLPVSGATPLEERYFTVCMHADPVGTTTASMVAELPAEPERPLVYWGSFGSPCVGVFLPYYVDGELPPVLARGGAESSADSPWWRFKALLTRVERDWERHGPPLRAQWAELEARLATDAAAVEREATQLRRAGEPARAASLLTRSMQANVAEMLRALEHALAAL